MAKQKRMAREQVYSWLHSCLEAALLGQEQPARPTALKRLDQPAAHGAELLSTALEHSRDDLIVFSIRATQAQVVLEEADWPQAAQLARSLALMPALDLAEAGERKRAPIRIEQIIQNMERLRAMFDQLEQSNPRADTRLFGWADAELKFIMAGWRLEIDRTFAWTTEQDIRGHVIELEHLTLHLEALLVSALAAQVDMLIRLTAYQLLRSLAELVTCACQVHQWQLAARHRGRYVRWWREIGAQSTPDRPDDDGSALPEGLFEQIGVGVGRMHAKNFTHGTLLLENFGPEGELSNLSNARSLGSLDVDALVKDTLTRVSDPGALTYQPSDSFWATAEHTYVKESMSADAIHAALVDDLIPLRYQLSPSQWAAFARGYAQGNTNAEAVLATVESRVPDSELGREAERVPNTPLNAPHFAIRACGYAFRNFLKNEVDLENMLARTRQASELGIRVGQLIEIAITATDLDPQVGRSALEDLVATIDGALRAGQFSLAIEVCAQSISELRPLPGTPEQILTAYLYWAQAGLAIDDNTRAELLLRAARTFIEVGGSAEMTHAIEILRSTLPWAAGLAIGGEMASTLSRHLVAFALRENDARYLALAVTIPTDYPNLRDPHLTVTRACAKFAEALVTDETSTRRVLLQSARELSQGVPALAELCDQVDRLLPPSIDGQHVGDEGMLYANTLRVEAYMGRGDWEGAAAILQRDLTECEAHNPESMECRIIASYLAMALRHSADYKPWRRKWLAKTLQGVMQRYAPKLLSDENIGQAAERSLLAGQAGNIGFAAVDLSTFLVGDQGEMLETGVRLLEMALRLSPREEVPEMYSLFANNLAVGYRAQAARQAGDERQAGLARAVSVLQSVVEVDQQLARSDSPRQRAVAETIYMDYLNLGLTYNDLAQSTYDTTWISKKPLDSARWYRKAIEALGMSRDLAIAHQRPAIAGTAQNNLADIYVSLCEYYALEQYWSGKDLPRAFYDWLCVFAGGHAKMATLLDLCAQSALENASEAVAIGIQGNPALMQESITFLLRLWGLINRQYALPDYIARHALITVLESLEALERQSAFEHFGDELKGLAELRGVVEALFRVEFYQSVTHDPEDLQTAHVAFTSLSHEKNMIARALARPRANWLGVQSEPDSLVVNGLFMAKFDESIELRIPSQRRRLRIHGVQVQHIGCQMRETSQLITRCGGTLAPLEPLLNWEDLPAATPSGKLLGTVDGGRVALEVTRLPIVSWDTWMLDLTIDCRDDITLTLSLPYAGKYNLIDGTLDSSFPAVLENPAQILIFGEQGITLEITLPGESAAEQPEVDGDTSEREEEFENAEDERAAGWEAPGQDEGVFATEEKDARAVVLLRGSVDNPEIQIKTTRLVCLLKATPRVTSADVGFLVKQDNSPGATCCAASFSLIAPSYSFPTSALHSFSPLFFFKDTVSPASLDFINQLNLHEIVMVGIPDNPVDADTALNAAFDPRRELFLLVDETERTPTISAVQRLRERMSSSIAGSYLMTSAASQNCDYDPFENIQVIVVPRHLTGAATQMLLDLAAVRRQTVEGIPFVVEKRIDFLSIKGNARQEQRNRTLFYEVATWKDLQDRYCTLPERSPKLSMRDPSATDKMLSVALPSLAKHPCFLLPPGIPSSLAAIPYVRLLGALPLPAEADSMALLQRLQPTDVYAPEQVAEQVPAGNWIIHRIPATPEGLARHFQAVAGERYTNIVARIGQTHPHLLSSRDLLEEMQPSEYIVLSLDGEKEQPWTYLAANYAAALSAPLLLLDIGAARNVEILDGGPGSFSGGNWTPPEDIDLARHVRPGTPGDRRTIAGELFGDAIRVLLDMKPAYVGFTSSLPELPIELAGDPPLSALFAVGRLAGPDLDSTSLLIARAALGEDSERPATIDVLLAEGADAIPAKPLPGARSEVAAIYKMLSSETDMHAELIEGDADIAGFLERLETANLVHFAGHGFYDEQRPTHSGLVFRRGVLTPGELTLPLSGTPIIFSNACETGLLGRGESVEGGRGRSGLAATFIALGAVNYLGSLWPIFDESSRRIAESFYRHLRTGYPVGEALRRARLDAYKENDPTWAAFVLFGCPRNRLRAEPIRQASRDAQ